VDDRQARGISNTASVNPPASPTGSGRPSPGFGPSRLAARRSASCDGTGCRLPRPSILPELASEHERARLDYQRDQAYL
jgi:hypothetical protein